MKNQKSTEGAEETRDKASSSTHEMPEQARSGGNETAELSKIQAELEESRDRLLRTTAELDNYRKRATRELESERRYAALPLLRDLLPVVDNMKRAIEAAEKTQNAAALLEGFKLVAQQLETIFNQHHCVRIEALGKNFDPHVHEAISQMATDKHPPGTVLAVASEGYLLNDRVVRPAQVVVAAAPS